MGCDPCLFLLECAFCRKVGWARRGVSLDDKVNSRAAWVQERNPVSKNQIENPNQNTPLSDCIPVTKWFFFMFINLFCVCVLRVFGHVPRTVWGHQRMTVGVWSWGLNLGGYAGLRAPLPAEASRPPLSYFWQESWESNAGKDPFPKTMFRKSDIHSAK